MPRKTRTMGVGVVAVWACVQWAVTHNTGALRDSRLRVFGQDPWLFPPAPPSPLQPGPAVARSSPTPSPSRLPELAQHEFLAEAQVAELTRLHARHFPLYALFQTSRRPSDPDPFMRQLALASLVHALFPDRPVVGSSRQLLVVVALDAQSFRNDRALFQATLASLDEFAARAPWFVDVRVVAVWGSRPRAGQGHWLYKHLVLRCVDDPRCDFVLEVEDDWFFPRERLPWLTMERLVEVMESDGQQRVNYVRWNKFPVSSKPEVGSWDLPCVEGDAVRINGSGHEGGGGSGNASVPVSKVASFSHNPHVVRARWLPEFFGPKVFWDLENRLNQVVHARVFGPAARRAEFGPRADGTCAHKGTGEAPDWQGLYLWGTTGQPPTVVHMDGKRFDPAKYLHTRQGRAVLQSDFVSCCVDVAGRKVRWA